MSGITIYHYPRCKKSRDGLKYLQEHGIEPNIVKYLETPPSEEELRDLVDKLGVHPIEIVRRREQEYKDLNLQSKKEDTEALIKVMAEHPRLIQRPIVIKGNEAVLARPAEKIQELL